MAEENAEAKPVESKPVQDQPTTAPSSGKPSAIWYLLPIFLSLIGGIIAFVLLRNKDSGMAKNCLIIGVVLFVVGMAINTLYLAPLLMSLMA